MITVGIPFYNAGAYLADAIKSVILQSFENWELILVDDGSTDQSLNIAMSYAKKDSRIRVISDGMNKRLPARLNQIVLEASYPFIARMDADDISSTYRLEKQLEFLVKNPEIDLVSTGILSLKNDLSLVGYRGTKSDKKISINDAIVGNTGIIHASILARKSFFMRNLYNERNKLAEDYELWLEAFLKNDLKVGFIEEPLYYYREDQNIVLSKLIKAYSTQAEIIKSIDLKYISLQNKLKFILKFEIKKIIVRVLFLLNLDKILHRRRANSEMNAEYAKILQDQVDLIRSINP